MIPDKIGRYQVEDELGRGGMATVYRARDPIAERDVAIKVLPPEMMHDPQFKVRFEREAKVIAILEHPANSRPTAPSSTACSGQRGCPALTRLGWAMLA